MSALSGYSRTKGIDSKILHNKLLLLYKLGCAIFK